MKKKLVTINPDDTVFHAAKLMAENDIGSIIVVKGDKPVGIITERDMVTRVLAKALDNPSTLPVREIMSKDLKTIKPEKTVTDAAEMMRENNIRRLIVTNNGRVVGIITSKDILQVYPEIIGILYEKLTLNISPPRRNRKMKYSGICEVCGSYSNDLMEVNGILICPECREGLR